MRILLFTACTLLITSSVARADDASADAKAFTDAIAKSAAPLSVTRGALAGKGAATLQAAIDDASFVMLGEDHGIEQIPTLATALCNELAPHGFHRLAIEVGPSVAPKLAAMAAAKDGAAQNAAFTAKYPETIAFYDWKEDFAFLSACAKATGAQHAPLELWGVDQELMGASGLLLQQILDTQPGPKAKAAIEALAQENVDDRAAVVKSGDFTKLFMMSAKQAALDEAAALLAAEGTAPARAIFESLLASRAIYQGQLGPEPYLSNRARAQLMKHTFFDHLGAAAAQDKGMPKILVKLGAWHLYRGLNPLRSSELGNLIAEAAEAHRVKAVNLLVLGVAGKQLTVGGPGKYVAQPLDLRAKDSDYAVLAPFFAAQAPKAWTLFDLRTLRAHFGEYGKLDPELERTIFGYDFLVLIADPRPQHPMR
jgi:hypothetical protein